MTSRRGTAQSGAPRLFLEFSDKLWDRRVDFVRLFANYDEVEVQLADRI